MNSRTTADHITQLEPGQIFVFGSNIGGRHGKGAAKFAVQKFGAVYGQGVGLQGRSYGIPTVNASITAPLSLPKIAGYVSEFVEFARTRPDLTFLVTEIGCGLAGLTVKEIAPLFVDAMDVPNIWLPRRFWRVLEHYR